MKKILAIILATTLVLSLTACGFFKCDVCGKTKFGESTGIFGAEICGSCVDDAKSLFQ